MMKIILSGCNGSMGQVITKLVQKSDDAKIVCGLDISTQANNGYPVFDDLFDCDAAADVIIDFSHPAALSKVLKYAVDKKIPVVVATTGLSKEQLGTLDSAAESVPVFFSANMSLGINLIIDLAAKAAQLLEDSFDIEIIEKHHNQKIDAPSGTALMIADAISDSLNKSPEYVYDRHSVRKKRDKNEIGIHAIRGGTIVGEHTVLFSGQDEVIEIHHSAASKEVFGVGAYKAAKFLVGKPNGMYNMKDLVNSKQ